MEKLDFVWKVDTRLRIGPKRTPILLYSRGYSKSTQKIMNFWFLRHLRNPAD